MLPRHGPTSMLRVADEAGLSGPMAAIVCLLAALAMGLVSMVVMLGEAQRRAQAAADLGAISALQGGDPGADPCVTARTVVTENRAALDDCRADGTAGVKVSVSVAAPIVWMDPDWRVRARARAVNEAEYRGGS